jgi:hypothetical protein
MNQWAFRHSARNLPLKLSMNALSVGLPGREKSGVTHLRADPFEHFNHICGPEAEPRNNRRREPAERVDHRQNAQLWSRCELVMEFSSSERARIREAGQMEGRTMKRLRFTEEQIIGVLKEAEGGAKAGELARRHGVFEATI